MKLPPFKPHPELDALLENVKFLAPMTREQQNAQRKSWVIGEMMLSYPEMTRERAESIFFDLEGY